MDQSGFVPFEQVDQSIDVFVGVFGVADGRRRFGLKLMVRH